MLRVRREQELRPGRDHVASDVGSANDLSPLAHCMTLISVGGGCPQGACANVLTLGVQTSCSVITGEFCNKAVRRAR